MAELEVPEGVQAFNLWTIHIMARLWEEFPRPQYFYNNPNTVFVTGNSTVAGAQLGQEGQVVLFQHTLNWLIEEGFARGTARASGDFTAVTLTTKGFSVLNQVPRSLASEPASTKEKTLGVLIREAVVSQASARLATALMQKILEEGR